MEFNEVIKIRHSVRKYNSKPVEEEKILSILEAARMAPSWANRQCWEFIVVKNEGTIKKISEYTSAKFVSEAPVVIFVCANPERSGKRNGMDYFLVDAAIAMEHIVLAATNEGLGSCWIGAFEEKPLKEILNVPVNYRIVAFTPVGYPADKKSLSEVVARFAVGADTRRILKDMVHNERW